MQAHFKYLGFGLKSRRGALDRGMERASQQQASKRDRREEERGKVEE